MNGRLVERLVLVAAAVFAVAVAVRLVPYVLP